MDKKVIDINTGRTRKGRRKQTTETREVKMTPPYKFYHPGTPEALAEVERVMKELIGEDESRQVEETRK